MIIKPVNPSRLTCFYFSGNMPQYITSYLSSCSFSFEHCWASLLFNSAGGKKQLSQAKGSVIEAC